MKKRRYLSLIVVILIIFWGFCNLVCAENDENLVIINAMPVILPDPALSMDWYDTQVVYNLYSPLVYSTPEGTIRPHLAQDWKIVDGKANHYRFTLRQGVKFHDGSELTSEDVVFSMDRYTTMGQGFSGMLGKVNSIAVDKYVVDFILEKNNTVFPEILTLFFPLNKDLVLEHLQAGKYGEFGDYGEDWLSTHDAGSGPYIMESHKMGESLEATRFKEYFLGWENWGPNEEPIERLKFIMETESVTRVMLLKSGQLDFEINGFFSREVFRGIINTKGLNLNMFWPMMATCWMNTKVPPTDDVHFRKAILYAYDYEAINSEYAFLGTRETGIIPSQLLEFVSIPPQPRQQNLEKAKEELALSKYNPADYKVGYHYVKDQEFNEEVGLQLQADLAKIGVNVELIGIPWAQFAEKVAAPETTPHLMLNNFPLTYPSVDSVFYYMYHPNNVGGIYASHWCEDEEIGQLIDQSREEILDPEKRLELIRRIQEKIASLALAFYPFEMPAAFTSQDYLIGPKEIFLMTGPTVNMHNWRINLTQKQK